MNINDINAIIEESVKSVLTEKKKKSSKKKKTQELGADKEIDTKGMKKAGKSKVASQDYIAGNGFIVHTDRDYGNFNASDRDSIKNALNNPALNLTGLWNEYIGEENMSEELLQKIAAGERDAYKESLKIIQSAIARFIGDIS